MKDEYITDAISAFVEDYRRKQFEEELMKIADPNGWLVGLASIAKYAGASLAEANRKVLHSEILAIKVDGQWKSNVEWFKDLTWSEGEIIDAVDPDS